MKNFILNTDALAQSKEGAILEYPEREKAPLYFYKNGEEKKSTVYVSAKWDLMAESATIEFFGLETPKDLRGLNPKVTFGFSSEQKYIMVCTNFDTSLNTMMLSKIWPGGPYSFLSAIVAVSKEIVTPESFSWLPDYLLKGGIGVLANKRMKWVNFFEDFKKIFK